MKLTPPHVEFVLFPKLVVMCVVYEAQASFLSIIHVSIVLPKPSQKACDNSKREACPGECVERTMHVLRSLVKRVYSGGPSASALHRIVKD